MALRQDWGCLVEGTGKTGISVAGTQWERREGVRMRSESEEGPEAVPWFESARQCRAFLFHSQNFYCCTWPFTSHQWMESDKHNCSWCTSESLTVIKADRSIEWKLQRREWEGSSKTPQASGSGSQGITFNQILISLKYLFFISLVSNGRLQLSVILLS